MKRLFENLTILIGSIIIGIPLGFLVGMICWFRFPYQVYLESRAKLARRRLDEAREFVEQYEKESSVEGMWERHIERIKNKKQSYDN